LKHLTKIYYTKQGIHSNLLSRIDVQGVNKMIAKLLLQQACTVSWCLMEQGSIQTCKGKHYKILITVPTNRWTKALSLYRTTVVMVLRKTQKLSHPKR